ncbi:CHAP domain-containing protein [Candidatus Saccharibacteria bacterium]|nr:CHAP domain-containing protein [Candidatus Saccharibacteria bacterium]
MVIFENKNRIIFVALAALLMVPILNLLVTSGGAEGISKACRNSKACLEAVEKEQEANRNAASAAQTANAYQIKVSELTAEIAGKEAEIVETETEIRALKTQIRETEKKLRSEQEALAELLVNMHFESDAEPIKILAGASSISDLAEKAAREEVVKEQISISAAKVREVKEELEANRAEVEDLLAQQQAAKESMVSKRTEQQALVEKYENDAEAYAEVAKAAVAAQREAEKAEQDAHPELYRGSAYTGANTYPWQGDCPARQDDYLTYWEDSFGVHKIGGYVCECVSYAGWKAYEAYGVAAAWGNAYSWDDGARAAGYLVDKNPAAGTIGQIDGSPYGHVFWVESVNADGSINVTEYNNWYATYLYSGISRSGDFGARTIGAGEVWQYNFIHLE